MGNCNNCDCNNKADKMLEYDDTVTLLYLQSVLLQKLDQAKFSEEPVTVAQKRAQQRNNSQMNSSQMNGLRFTFQKQSLPPLQSMQREQLAILAKDKMGSIIKIQALWRGYRARLMSDIIKKENRLKKKYFLDEEFYETLSKTRKFKEMQKSSKEYVYMCTGAKYSGSWVGGFRHGQGMMLWADGAEYNGQWMYGKATGKGVFTHTKGEKYEGEWYNDKAHGYGVYIHTNGAKYEGQWFNDLQHGKGTETWPDKSIFVGEYRDGRKNGVGKYIWGDGASYEGEWEDNEICGCGFYQWNDGRKYLGHWRGNVMEEFGIYTWQDGRKYEGFYKDDKKHGYGIYTWSDSKRYAGWWVHGKQHGIGIFISKEGKKRLGLWEDGKKVKWFNADDVQKIEDGTLEIAHLFENKEESWQKMEEFLLQFQPPQEYTIAKQRILNQVKVMKIDVNLSNDSIYLQQSMDQGGNQY